MISFEIITIMILIIIDISQEFCIFFNYLAISIGNILNLKVKVSVNWILSN